MPKEKTKNLFLILSKEWYDKINSGEKQSEYRSTSKYYASKFEGREYETVEFQLGYSKKYPRLKFIVKTISKTKEKNDLNEEEVWEIKLGHRVLYTLDKFNDITMKKDNNEFFENMGCLP